MHKYKKYLTEKFYKSDNINTSYYKGYVELFKNPTHSELNNLYKVSYDAGIRLGIDKNNDIYAWIEDVLHNEIQKKFKLNFILRLEYTKNRDILYLATGETEKRFKKVDKKVLDKLKKLFPMIRTIEMVSSPFDVVYGWKS